LFAGGMLVWGRGVGAPTSVDQLREMSLFHDFKLKRRKVDSRCSTEGERVVQWLADENRIQPIDACLRSSRYVDETS